MGQWFSTFLWALKCLQANISRPTCIRAHEKHPLCFVFLLGLDKVNWKVIHWVLHVAQLCISVILYLDWRQGVLQHQLGTLNKMITSSWLIRNLLFRTQSDSQGAPRISPAEMAPISLSVFEGATVSKLFLKASDLECGRQEPSHIVTSPALAACSQRSSCLLFERTQWSSFQARNEFAQLKVLHHLSLME